MKLNQTSTLQRRDQRSALASRANNL
jgi:hypothetical protein